MFPLEILRANQKSAHSEKKVHGFVLMNAFKVGRDLDNLRDRLLVQIAVGVEQPSVVIDDEIANPRRQKTEEAGKVVSYCLIFPATHAVKRERNPAIIANHDRVC